MNITHQDLLSLAKLSKFSFTDQELEHFTTDLKNIIDYISTLDQLDTENITPTYEVNQLENIWRDDEITPQDATPDQLLALAPLTDQHQIKVPKVL